jgi:zinc transporter ZupT
MLDILITGPPVGGALVAFWAGFVFDRSGSYNFAFSAASGFLLFIVLSILFV